MILYRSQSLEIQHPWFSWMLISDLTRDVLELPGNLFDLNVNRLNAPAALPSTAMVMGALPMVAAAAGNMLRGNDGLSRVRLPDMPGGPAETNALRLLLSPSELFRYGHALLHPTPVDRLNGLGHADGVGDGGAPDGTSCTL